MQPASLDIGLELTPLVAARLDEMVDMVADELAAIGLPPREAMPNPCGRKAAP